MRGRSRKDEDEESSGGELERSGHWIWLFASVRLLPGSKGHQYVRERKEEDSYDHDDEQRRPCPIPVDECSSDAAINKDGFDLEPASHTACIA
jgi:hypothetical protein